MNKKYVLKLTAEERVELERRTRRGIGTAEKLRRARGLLLVDQSGGGKGWTDRPAGRRRRGRDASEHRELAEAGLRGRPAGVVGAPAAKPHLPDSPGRPGRGGAGQAGLLEPAARGRSLESAAAGGPAGGVGGGRVGLARDRAADASKNEVKPHLKRHWCIPPKDDAAFVADMEKVLDVYERPHDPKRPVVCMDEQPKQLIEQSRPPLATRPGSVDKEDHEYVRHGVCNVWMFNEPLGGWRDVRVTDRKTAVDWAHQVKLLVDHRRYRNAHRITLVCDQLKTHAIASLYKAFEPAEAHRIASKIELVHTPKHGSWLNTSECELSVLTRQCLGRRIATTEGVRSEAEAWARRRNRLQIGVNWQFTTVDARVKLKSLYPKLDT